MTTHWLWIITAVSIFATWLNVRKSLWCFRLWLFTNAAWAVVDSWKGLWPQALLFVVYFGLAAYGLMKWKKEKGL